MVLKDIMVSKFTTTLGVDVVIPSVTEAKDFKRRAVDENGEIIVPEVLEDVHIDAVSETIIPFNTTEIIDGNSLADGVITVGADSDYGLSIMLNIKTFTGIGTGIIEVRLMINDVEEATDAFQETFLSPTQPTFKLDTNKSLVMGDQVKVVVYQTTGVPIVCDWAEFNLLKV